VASAALPAAMVIMKVRRELFIVVFLGHASRLKNALKAEGLRSRRAQNLSAAAACCQRRTAVL
jgi:hypothetical protein